MQRIPTLHHWRKLAAINPRLADVAEELLRHIPTAIALVFYGSQVEGETDQYSDYDVLVIAPSSDVPGWRERTRLLGELAERLGVKVQLVTMSPKAAWLELRLKPYLRHWLERGVILGDGSIFAEPFPPLAKLGARDCLITIEIDLEEMIEEEDGRRWKGEQFLRALCRLLMVRAAIGGSYGSDVKQEVKALIGATTLRRLRNPKRRVSAEDVARLKAALDALLAEVRELIEAMPENSSDREIRRLQSRKAV
jgi:predicted nucleotidyltransferase